ncbi:MAG: hypothetical protein R6U02_00605 [Alkalibacterium sp.]|uniref:hypothetical protein n=1 Tax=Alkalibacterium sp. TaxID=1872447 RepID=UPI0039709CB5
MTQEIVKLSPDALGYKDRGKMKWTGLMLSDHSEALKKQKQTTQSLLIAPKPKQSLEEISACLYRSYVNKRPLAIQLDIIKEGCYLPDTEGVIVGSRDDTIYIKQRDRETKRIDLEDIRHVDWIDTTQWYEKYEKQHVTI